MLLQGGDAADLTAVGDVLSVQSFSFAQSNQAMRRARLGYGVSLAAQRVEDGVIGDTMVEYDVAHRADTLPWNQRDSSCLSRTTTSSRLCQKWICPLCSSSPRGQSCVVRSQEQPHNQHPETSARRLGRQDEDGPQRWLSGSVPQIAHLRLPTHRQGLVENSSKSHRETETLHATQDSSKA